MKPRIGVGWLAWLAVALPSIAGCQLIVPPAADPVPDCSALRMAPGRCQALATAARSDLPDPSRPATGVRLLPPQDDDARLTVAVYRMRFEFADGTFAVGQVTCGIANIDRRECSDDPGIPITPVLFRDLPCTGEAGAPGSVCATPDPTPAQAAVAQARALQVAAIDIPIPGPGHYEIEVGRAALPDGYLSDLTMRLADPAPDALYVPEGIRLEVRPVDPARPPFRMLHGRPPMDGPEEVVVILVFDVVEAGPGALLQVRDLVAR